MSEAIAALANIQGLLLLIAIIQLIIAAALLFPRKR